MELFKSLQSKTRYLSQYQLIWASGYSRSQFYKWLRGVFERKQREGKPISQDVVESAVSVIAKYPHLGAVKGQCYMIYHQLGYIPQHVYKRLKKIAQRLIFQEISRRELLEPRSRYNHERADGIGQIWAEDFTRLKVSGESFNLSLVIDVYDGYYLGTAATRQMSSKTVEAPIVQALEENNGCGPERFILSDNGSQYVSGAHGQFLEKSDIVHKRIPSCTPQYNGSVECGIKEFKNVFYNVWAERESRGVDKERLLLKRVQLTGEETRRRMNFEIPRPSLNGVTPADVHKGIAEQRRAQNREYTEQELEKRGSGRLWHPNNWQLVKDTLFKGGMNDIELMTKFCFFLKRPLRKLANLSTEVLGN